MNSSERVNRRDFVKMLSIVGGGVAVFGLSACESNTEITGSNTATSSDPLTSSTPITTGTSATINEQKRTVGLFLNDTRAWPGYTLMAPKQYTSTYLLNNQGQAVHTWKASKYPPGQWAHLLENGHLLRAATTRNDQVNTGGGEGGRIEEYDWDDNLVWELDYSTGQYMQHHDFVPLPNGNILMLVVEKKTYEEAIASGLNPARMPEVQKMGYILPDAVVEVQPTRPKGGIVVWSWHVWDHLIQDFAANKNNYGNVADHPELVDPNRGNQIPVFWNHMNSITYNAALDQVLLSVRGNSEFWIIDHNTTTAEAAAHTGGKHGRGGDLLYRWGNPMQYRAGTQSNQMLFQQHCAMWIGSNCPGAGNILVFNNGIGRSYTTVDELTPPMDTGGNYPLSHGSAFGPKSLTWTYKANPPTSFYAAEISGAQRLPNGNTLICDGDHGILFEVTSQGETVWKYVNPVVRTGPLGATDTIPPDTAKQDQLLNEVFRVQRYPLDYAGFASRDLSKGLVIEK
jgi:hypothetical protein